MKIEIGGQREMEGWVNLDLKEGFNVILDELPVEDNSVEYLYMSHVIEHMPMRTAIRVLSNLYKKLKSGGKIRILCPDFNQLVHRLFNPSMVEVENQTRFEPWLNPDAWKVGTIPPLYNLFGALSVANATFLTAHEPINTKGEPIESDLYLTLPDGRRIAGVTHAACWNAELLEQILYACGYRNIEVTGFEDIDKEQERKGQLCMNAYKEENAAHKGGFKEFIEENRIFENWMAGHRPMMMRQK
jgi:hypothetical protein